MDDSSTVRAYSRRAEKERDGVQRGMADFEPGRQSRLEPVTVLVLEVRINALFHSSGGAGDAVDESIGYLLEPGCWAGHCDRARGMSLMDADASDERVMRSNTYTRVEGRKEKKELLGCCRNVTYGAPPCDLARLGINFAGAGGKKPASEQSGRRVRVNTTQYRSEQLSEGALHA